MLKRALKSPITNVLRPIAPVVMVAVVFAIAVLGLFMAADLLDHVPTVTMALTGTTLGPRLLVFGTAAVLGLFVGGCYLLYRSYEAQIRAYWRGYSTWAKAITIGSLSALAAALALGIAYAVGRVALSELLVVVLVTWPVVVGTVLLGYRRSSRADSRVASIKTGYVLTRGLESRTLSIIVGLLVAIGFGLVVDAVGTWYYGSPPDRWVPVLGACVLWLLVTVLAYNRYENTTDERVDLTILELETPDARDVQELLVKNESGRPIDLTESLLRDTDLDLYRPGTDFTLKPGQRGAFEIDDSFSLEPNDDAIELPLGYDLKRGGETPAVYTKAGAVHYLQWTTGPAEAIGRESSKHVTDSDSEPASPDAGSSGAGGSDPVTESPVTPSPQD